MRSNPGLSCMNKNDYLWKKKDFNYLVWVVSVERKGKNIADVRLLAWFDSLAFTAIEMRIIGIAVGIYINQFLNQGPGTRRHLLLTELITLLNISFSSWTLLLSDETLGDWFDKRLTWSLFLVEFKKVLNLPISCSTDADWSRHMHNICIVLCLYVKSAHRLALA